AIDGETLARRAGFLIGGRGQVVPFEVLQVGKAGAKKFSLAAGDRNEIVVEDEGIAVGINGKAVDPLFSEVLRLGRAELAAPDLVVQHVEHRAQRVSELQ